MILKNILGDVLSTGLNPDTKDIQLVDVETKTDYTPFFTLSAGLIIFITVIYFVSKIR